MPAKRREDWNLTRLHRTSQETFSLGDRVGRIQIFAKVDQRLIATLYYTPVSSRLKQIAEQMGAYLHAARDVRKLTDEYWIALEALVVEGVALLVDATTGTLLGPMLLNSSTSQSTMPVELLPDESGIVDNSLYAIKGNNILDSPGLTRYLSVHGQ